jgi:hypothetical protein
VPTWLACPPLKMGSSGSQGSPLGPVFAVSRRNRGSGSGSGSGSGGGSGSDNDGSVADGSGCPGIWASESAHLACTVAWPGVEPESRLENAYVFLYNYMHVKINSATHLF